MIVKELSAAAYSLRVRVEPKETIFVPSKHLGSFKQLGKGLWKVGVPKLRVFTVV
jgi:hypothetical protein